MKASLQTAADLALKAAPQYSSFELRMDYMRKVLFILIEELAQCQSIQEEILKVVTLSGDQVERSTIMHAETAQPKTEPKTKHLDKDVRHMLEGIRNSIDIILIAYPKES